MAKSKEVFIRRARDVGQVVLDIVDTVISGASVVHARNTDKAVKRAVASLSGKRDRTLG